MDLLRRSLEPVVRKALENFRVVFIGGPRQAGKTTLARRLGENRTFVTLDDLGALSAARSDPQGFVRGLSLPVTIDEIQRAPDLLLPIKRAVDEQPVPGSFLLTGSAAPQAVSAVQETLAGRMASMVLRPLTWGERLGCVSWNPLADLVRCRTSRDILSLFRRRTGPATMLEQEVLLGGFPEPAVRLAPGARADWHEQFTRSYLESDVPTFVRPDDITTFLRFVRLTAGTTGGLLNLAHVARDAGISHDTARRWLSVLRSGYVADLLPPYGANVRKRLVKSPKVHFVDTGLAAHLLGLQEWTQAVRVNLAGALTESWVHHHLEVLRAASTARLSLHHVRTASGEECDFLLESQHLLPIEVKSGQTLSDKDAAGLRAVLRLFPKQAFVGILLYSGTELIPFDAQIAAVPLSLFLTGGRDARES